MLSVKTTRNGYFDCVKFFIVFCMLWGHAIQYCSVNYNFFFQYRIQSYIWFPYAVVCAYKRLVFLLQRKQIYV